MLKSFNWRRINTSGGPRFWLKVALGVLALLNGVALFLFFAPPGGSRAELEAQDQHIRSEIAAARTQMLRLKQVSQKVQLGSVQSSDFESRYFLPKRVAYATVMAEIQRMAQAAGLQERNGVFTEEPIEGTSDLSLLNVAVEFEGPYNSFMKFLYESDHSPMLLMLDALAASPEQKPGQITTSARFQAIIREPAEAATGGQP